MLMHNTPMKIIIQPPILILVKLHNLTIIIITGVYPSVISSKVTAPKKEHRPLKVGTATSKSRALTSTTCTKIQKLRKEI